MEYIHTIQTKSELSSLEDKFAGVLSRAFFNDPYYLWIMPDERKRMDQLIWWMKILLRYTRVYGSIHYTDDEKGIAMWVGPEKPVIDSIKIFSMGLILYPLKIGFRNFKRLLDISDQWEKEHKKLDKRHSYLMVIGVEPEFQGKGIGSRMMEFGLQPADDGNLMCYLETVTEEDVRFYRKHGFDVMYNNTFGINEQYWLMTRMPVEQHMKRNGPHG